MTEGKLKPGKVQEVLRGEGKNGKIKENPPTTNKCAPMYKENLTRRITQTRFP